MRASGGRAQEFFSRIFNGIFNGIFRCCSVLALVLLAVRRQYFLREWYACVGMCAYVGMCTCRAPRVLRWCVLRCTPEWTSVRIQVGTRVGVEREWNASESVVSTDGKATFYGWKFGWLGAHHDGNRSHFKAYSNGSYLDILANRADPLDGSLPYVTQPFESGDGLGVLR
jgi:hypothetical protein